jgi:hypothetical protein
MAAGSGGYLFRVIGWLERTPLIAGGMLMFVADLRAAAAGSMLIAAAALSARRAGGSDR